MSIKDTVTNTAADLARAVFDYAITLVSARIKHELPGKTPDFVTREDFEQAIIALRFETMELQTQQLDEMIATAKREADEAYARGLAMSEGMDITVVTDTDDSDTK